jgi:hypothetical protein
MSWDDLYQDYLVREFGGSSGRDEADGSAVFVGLGGLQQAGADGFALSTPRGAGPRRAVVAGRYGSAAVAFLAAVACVVGVLLIGAGVNHLVSSGPIIPSATIANPGIGLPPPGPAVTAKGAPKVAVVPAAGPAPLVPVAATSAVVPARAVSVVGPPPPTPAGPPNPPSPPGPGPGGLLTGVVNTVGNTLSGVTTTVGSTLGTVVSTVGGIVSAPGGVVSTVTGLVSTATNTLLGGLTSLLAPPHH